MCIDFQVKIKTEVIMQGNKLYVGNLSYSVTNEELSTLFSQHGEVESVNVIEGKGFAFVEMGNQAEAETAKEKLDGFEFKGRALRVNEAKPRDNSRKKSFGRRY
jgi:RNA recognition motif-containing protein